MDWIEELQQEKVIAFIQEHLKDDPLQLVLRGAKYPNMPVKAAAQQIQARQKARQKLPQWEALPELIFPPTISMEQCSSQLTAEFKASLVSGKQLIDLTGGFGVDTYYFSQSFEQVDYVERQQELVRLVAYNMQLLKAEHVHTHHAQAEEFLNAFKGRTDVIYLDPARRGEHNEKVFLLSDCEPDVTKLLPLLFEKAHQVFIKTSPMLDISRANAELQNIEKIYVLAVDNECKEVLYLLSEQAKAEPEMICVNLSSKDRPAQAFSFTPSQESNAAVELSEPLQYIYEPNVALLKAGAYKSIAQAYGVYKLHAHSHVYTSKELIEDFPGRVFELQAVCSLNKKELAKYLPAKKVNITVRNFPQSVQEIRKKTGLKEGGEDYLLATTDMNGKAVILVTKRV
jgi:16S rRNA G966 N2-methylase RsmD